MNRRNALGIILLELRRRRQRRRFRRIFRTWWVRPIYQERRELGDWYKLIPKMRESDHVSFFNYLRMSPAQFDLLLSIVEGDLIKLSWRECISPGERLAITLRYLASGDLMASIAFAFRISRSSVSIIVRETCSAIWKRLYHLIFEEPSREMWVNVAANFEQRWNFPHCIGGLDGKHVVVPAFANSGSECFNYKGSHSVVLLALVGANYKFLVVDIGASGRCTDGGVLSSSLLGRALISNTLDMPPPRTLPGTNVEAPYALVADDAFPLKTYLMKPFAREFLPPEQIIFNYRLSRSRMVVENAFGILSARWRIYRKPIVGGRKLVHLIIKATVCLHNFMIGDEENLRIADRRYVGPQTADMHDMNGEVVMGQWRNGVGGNDAIRNIDTVRMGARNASQAAKDVREKYVDYFLGPEAVAWQWLKLPEVDLE